MHARLLLPLFGFALLLWNGSARAEPLEKARALYDSGMTHYNLSEYDKALADFKEAYRLKHDPAFLFNIGQCQRQTGDYEGAQRSYRAFLRELPDAPARTRDEVQRLIASMDLALKERRAQQPPTGTTLPMGTTPPNDAKTTPARPPTAAPPIATTPPPTETATPTVQTPMVVAQPASTKQPLYKKWWLWTAVGVGAAALAVGLSVGLAPHSVSYPSAPNSAATIRW